MVQLQSKLNNKSLRVLENGFVDCMGDGGTACEYMHTLWGGGGKGSCGNGKH